MRGTIVGAGVGALAAALAVTPAVLLLTRDKGDGPSLTALSSGASATTSTSAAPSTTALPATSAPQTAPPPTARPATPVTTTAQPKAGVTCEASFFSGRLATNKRTYGPKEDIDLKATFTNTSGRPCRAVDPQLHTRIVDSAGRSMGVGVTPHEIPLDPPDVAAGEAVTLTHRIGAPCTVGPGGCEGLPIGDYTVLLETAPFGDARSAIHVVAPGARPPDSVLLGAAGEVAGVQGSYCWRSPDGTGLCADTVAPNPAETLTVRQGETLSLIFDDRRVPRQIVATLFDTGRRSFQPQVDVTPASESTFRADFPVGAWLLDVGTFWSEGDAFYSFRIDVQP